MSALVRRCSAFEEVRFFISPMSQGFRRKKEEPSERRMKEEGVVALDGSIKQGKLSQRVYSQNGSSAQSDLIRGVICIFIINVIAASG
jgi:hypothetical protein